MPIEHSIATHHTTYRRVRRLRQSIRPIEHSIATHHTTYHTNSQSSLPNWDSHSRDRETEFENLSVANPIDKYLNKDEIFGADHIIPEANFQVNS